MALHGEGEPHPTLLQAATQAATIELFTQWQTYRNGVHMDWDTFRSIDFKAIAIAVMTASGWEFTADEVPDMPKLRALLTKPSPFAALDENTAAYDAMMARNDANELNNVTLAGTTRRAPYGLSADAIAEHGKQVQG